MCGVFMICLLFFLFSIIIIITIKFSDSFFKDVDGATLGLAVLETIGLIISLVVAIFELRKSTEVARATFVTELNKSFVENPDYKKLYDFMQNCFDGKCQSCPENNCRETDCSLNVDKSLISNYLTFFETLYILHKRNVISFDIIDDLFAYRFFLIVHSRLVQKEKLIPQPENFHNIYRLEHDWLEYRIKHGKLTREDIQNSCQKYKENLNKEDSPVRWVNVYTARPLKAVISEDLYKKIIK